MLRWHTLLLLIFLSAWCSCPALADTPPPNRNFSVVAPEYSLPDAPSVTVASAAEAATATFAPPPMRRLPLLAAPSLAFAQQNSPAPSSSEHFHWKGLLLQSFAFDLLQNATRIVTADQSDRHLLLNKPYWSDYWASLGQFNMRRWNDGDSFPVNYIGHPLQGAISGYIEIQNDPRGRNLILGRDGRAYWNSRFRAFLWNVVYSTQWEIGPFGETAIFNQGGFTYPIQCVKHTSAPGGCERPDAKYTNNTGWVDFIITPTVGTLWLFGEDAIDHLLTDHLVERHPGSFKYELLRSGLNPPRSLANILRGHFPWWRDYEHPGDYQSYVVGMFDRALDEQPRETGEFSVFYSSLDLYTNHVGCLDCRTSTSGVGAALGLDIRRYLDFVTIVRVHPDASPLFSNNIGGNLLAANFGLRSGYSGRHFALKATLAPGFASYSDTLQMPTAVAPLPRSGRNFNFSALADVSADLRFTRHLAFRAAVEQMLIRYKSPDRDPPGIGTPPRLSFLSHDNYINSTNWGVRLGPVFRF